MQFRATIRPRSFLWKLWTSERRIGGSVSGVQFRRVGTEFVSVDDPLPPDDVATLAHNNMVVLEISALPAVHPVHEQTKATPPAATPEPAPAPAPQAAPVDLRTNTQPTKQPDLRVPQKGWPGSGNGGGKRR